MKQLETEFTHQGRTLRQLKRQANVALYLICCLKPESKKKFLGYELAVIQIKNLKGGFEERYPQPNQKPKQSWHYDMCERHWAEKGFEALVEREKSATIPFAASPLGRVANVQSFEGKDSGRAK